MRAVRDDGGINRLVRGPMMAAVARAGGRNRRALAVTCMVALILPLACPVGFADSPRAVVPADDAPRDGEIRFPDWFKLSFLDLRADLDEAVEARGKDGLIVYFHQDDCPYCEALIDVNFRNPDIARLIRRHFDVVALDIWGAREVVDMNGTRATERELAVFEELNFTPSLLVYDATGKEALRLRGYYPPYRFRAALEYVVDGHYKKEPLREYLKRADPPPKFDLADLNEEPFFSEPPHLLDRSRVASDRPLAVFFEQRDCHACDVLHSEPLESEGVRERLRRLEVVQLDRHSDLPVITPTGRRTTAGQWADELDVHYAPTVVFFDAKGAEIIRLDSVTRLYRLRGVLDYVLSGGYRDTPRYYVWRRARLRSPSVQRY